MKRKTLTLVIIVIILMVTTFSATYSVTAKQLYLQKIQEMQQEKEGK